MKIPGVDRMKRRFFLKKLLAGSALAVGRSAFPEEIAKNPGKPPNVVFVLADQWRAQAMGYMGDGNVKTPNLDALAKQHVVFTNAISGCPVCSPYRASLITGQNPLSHGVFVNDVHLNDDAISIGEVYRDHGYQTAYIGKWHLEGHGRSAYIPPEKRQGFQFWRVLECTHDYNQSYYYGDGSERQMWDGYDACAQTKEAQRYIREVRDKNKPFMLMLSWGPPHNPYQTAPEKYRKMYDPAKLALRANVPAEKEEEARNDLAGYYAHCSALDEYVGDLIATLKEENIEGETIFVFTSDHGDMLGSQGQNRKQRPYDEAIRVPFILKHPVMQGKEAKQINIPIASYDIMPTLLGLCRLPAPKTVEGKNWSRDILETSSKAGDDYNDAVLIACYSPFGEWIRENGGREYRGIRTRRYTYVKDLKGPWLLFDNQQDPFQLTNVCDQEAYKDQQAKLEDKLKEQLQRFNDDFLPGNQYLDKWGYKVDKNGTVPYTP